MAVAAIILIVAITHIKSTISGYLSKSHQVTEEVNNQIDKDFNWKDFVMENIWTADRHPAAKWVLFNMVSKALLIANVVIAVFYTLKSQIFGSDTWQPVSIFLVDHIIFAAILFVLSIISDIHLRREEKRFVVSFAMLDSMYRFLEGTLDESKVIEAMCLLSALLDHYVSQETLDHMMLKTQTCIGGSDLGKSLLSVILSDLDSDWSQHLFTSDGESLLRTIQKAISETVASDNS